MKYTCCTASGDQQITSAFSEQAPADLQSTEQHYSETPQRLGQGKEKRGNTSVQSTLKSGFPR